MAIEEFRHAAAQGDAKGQYLLAIGYRYGTGVAQDPALALQWFARAAAQGYGDAAQQRDALAATMSRDDVAKALAQTSKAP